MSAVAAKPKHKGHRIGIYIRVSTEEQAENPEGSIKNQEERLRMTVKLKNMEGHFGEITHVYVDTKSGKDTNRPELQRMLLAISQRQIDLIMVTELSRISRSIKDFSDIWALMQKNKCGFHSLRENFDTTTAAGEMVLFTVANIAQFERRQISERVTANFNIRAQRGLFNGGAIPFGYKRLPDKRGYLVVDEKEAEVVRAAFKAFVREGYLMAAAKWLNEHEEYRLNSEMEGGGHKRRLGFFTVDNLQAMLRNRMYLGIRIYRHKGELKETEAVWPAIVDREVFDEANAILSKNKSTNKIGMAERYPFILAGFVSCQTCGDRMVGKSAHGKRDKIPYYEHAWATKKGAYVPGLKRSCQPNRILAKHIEPLVWNCVVEVLTSEAAAKALLGEAEKSHRRNPESKEAEKCKQVTFSVDRQLDTLAERLAALPQTISPTPIFKQMEKLEGIKREAQNKLSKLEQEGGKVDAPAELKDYALFLSTLRAMLNDGICPRTKIFILRKLLKNVVVTPEAVYVNFLTGANYIQRFLAQESGQIIETRKDSGGDEKGKKKAEGFSLGPIPDASSGCSNTLTIGWGGRTRTCE